MNETVLLRNQIAALTKERDEWMRSLEFSLKQRDKLNAERDDLSERYQTASRLAALSLEALSKALKERDALKDAARLALDALVDLKGIRMNEVEHLSVLRATNALKAVL